MTSASTLSSRARAEKNPKKAKALRAQAAKLRRDEREAKTAGSGAKIIKGLSQALEAVQAPGGWRAVKQGETVMMSHDEAASDSYAARHGAPGKGEIVGGALARKAEEMAKLARKSGGVDTIQTMLAQLESQARYEAVREAEQRFSKERLAVREAVRDKIVCGFIAEVETVQKAKSGLPPSQTWLVNAFTIVNLIDALNAAGYTAHGKR